MKTVFIDIDTQLDFVYPSGALYVPGAERILPAVAQLNRYAASQAIPVVSTMDAHTETDPEFRTWPHHCVIGCWGQRKAEATLLEKRVVVPNRPAELKLDGAQQIIVEKQTVDTFQSANFARVIEALGASRCVVYGVVTEICVLHAARGLLKAGRQVVVVTDAIETLKAEDSARVLDELCSSGAMLAPVAEIVG
jgi:nicotinamidase/pyrazinamidase